MGNESGETVWMQAKLGFLAEAPAEDVVKAVLVMLQSHHERELERLNEILAGFPDFLTDKLALTWTRLKAESPNGAEALCLLTQVIMAELDGGTMPLV